MNDRIVTDASAVLAVVSGEATRPVLLEKTQGKTLFSPASLPFEIGNALSAMLRRSRITRDEALALYAAYEEIPITLQTVDMIAAIEVAAEQNIYAYDAYMIVCARDLSCPLLTLDVKLRRVAEAVGVAVIDLGT